MKLINRVSKDFPKLVQMKFKIEQFLSNNPLPEPVKQINGKNVYKLIIPMKLSPNRNNIHQITYTVFVAFQDKTQIPIYIAAYQVETQYGINVGRHKMVWKDSTALTDNSFTGAVFFDGAMKTFDAVCTDLVHTVRAKSAWISRMKDALENSMFVYKVVINGKQQMLTRLKSPEEIDASSDQLWIRSDVGISVNTLVSSVEISV